MNKILWYDCETTGLSPEENDIIQIAGFVEIDGVISDEFNYKCRPYNLSNVSDEALKTTGYTINDIKNWDPPILLRERLSKIFNKHINRYDKYDKFLNGGFNINFDRKFLNSFYSKCNDKYLGSYLGWYMLDVYQLAVWYVYNNTIQNIENMKLETLCKYFDIEINAHDALSDIKATRELALKLLNTKGKL